MVFLPNSFYLYRFIQSQYQVVYLLDSVVQRLAVTILTKEAMITLQEVAVLIAYMVYKWLS